jgi:hypothetical protein
MARGEHHPLPPGRLPADMKPSRDELVGAGGVRPDQPDADGRVGQRGLNEENLVLATPAFIAWFIDRVSSPWAGGTGSR